MDMNIKVDVLEFNHFHLTFHTDDFYKNKYFGEEFIKKFKVGDPELFYIRDNNLAERLAWERYVRDFR